MLKYNCIIVEDEPLAIEVLKDFIGMMPSLQLKHICTDAIQALEILQQDKTDLIFLDIHLPELKGLDFIKAVRGCPPVIITSAYHQYALESYEYNVVDYLLKPFDFARFVKAVNKFDSPLKQAAADVSFIPEREYILITVNKKTVKIFTDEILYIESLREYVKIFTTTESVTTKLKIGRMEDYLQNNGFIRVHRSFIVSCNKITSFTVSYTEIKNKQIPIGRDYRDKVLAALKDGQIRR